MLFIVTNFENSMLQDNHISARQTHEFEVCNFIAPMKAKAELNISVKHSHSVARKELESFVLDKFQDCHSATIREFMPLLIDLGLGLNKRAVVGIRPGIERPFFLENYLDDPIEIALQELAGADVAREGIVEIGNFAADNVRLGSLLFTILAKGLLLAGYKWMVFTATNQVEKMIGKLGCAQTVLTDANASRVAQSPTDWGSYYDNNPKVIACNLQDTITKAEENVRLNQIFLEHSDEIARLATTLKSVGNGVFV
ncbi:MAG: hypothetical protein ACI9XU_002060 [Arenicella sp.]|jgi:hypothetical protein